MKKLFAFLALVLLVNLINAQSFLSPTGAGASISVHKMGIFKSFKSDLKDLEFVDSYSLGKSFGLQLYNSSFLQISFNYVKYAPGTAIISSPTDVFSSSNFFGLTVGRSIYFGGDKSGMYLNPNIGISYYNFSILSSSVTNHVGAYHSVNLYIPIELGYKLEFGKSNLCLGFAPNASIGSLGMFSSFGGSVRYAYFFKE
ncbi:MAG: hypothetical protein NT150_05085 [Bacteroidetes bacterium]|nr:hypothetical protein [Bacteroidota bacterium]